MSAVLYSLQTYWPVHLLLLLYACLLGYHAWTGHRATRGVADYYVGGRSMGGVVLGLSFFTESLDLKDHREGSLAQEGSRLDVVSMQGEQWLVFIFVIGLMPLEKMRLFHHGVYHGLDGMGRPLDDGSFPPRRGIRCALCRVWRHVCLLVDIDCWRELQDR